MSNITEYIVYTDSTHTHVRTACSLCVVGPVMSGRAESSTADQGTTSTYAKSCYPESGDPCAEVYTIEQR